MIPAGVGVGDELAVEVARTKLDREIWCGSLVSRTSHSVKLRLWGTRSERSFPFSRLARIASLALVDDDTRHRYSAVQARGAPALSYDVATKLGITREGLHRRTRELGWTEHEALTRPRRPYQRRTFRFRGREMTVPEIADALGMPRATLDHRLRRAGFDLERAVASPYVPRAQKET